MKPIHNHKLILFAALIMAAGFALSCASPTSSILPLGDEGFQWDEEVDKHIHDAKRAEKLKELGRQLEELQKKLSLETRKLENEFIALNADYSVTKDEMRQAFKRFEQKRNESLTKYREIIFSMRQLVSSKEWEVMVE